MNISKEIDEVLREIQSEIYVNPGNHEESEDESKFLDPQKAPKSPLKVYQATQPRPQYKRSFFSLHELSAWKLGLHIFRSLMHLSTLSPPQWMGHIHRVWLSVYYKIFWL